MENKVSIETIQEIIEKVLTEIVKHDNYLLHKKLKEECINHKLAIHIEKEITRRNIDNFHVDIEYNKNCNDPKYVEINGEQMSIRPDIIVHKRGSNKCNFLAIEAKKTYKSKHDIQKIQALLRSPYKFDFGCLISYLPEKSYIKYSILLFDKEVYEYVSINGIVQKKQVV